MERDKRVDLSKLSEAFFENLQIDNCEFGGLGVDCKRPFGNSDVCGDILEIIGWEMEGDNGNNKCYASYQNDYAYSLYHEYLIPFLQEQWKWLNVKQLAHDAIALCSELVEWHDKRNLSFGEKYE